MTDVTEVEVEDADGEVFMIPVVKAKVALPLKSGRLPDHVYREIFIAGAKLILNRGQTKITKAAYPDPEEMKKVALEKAEETLENMYAGKIRIAGGKASGKVPGVVMTEARRIARNLIKDELKRQGVRISMTEASEITKAANAYIANNPDIIKEAEEEIEKRAAKKVDSSIIAGIAVSAKKIKAAEARKAEKVLSAAKAGQIATRARPQPRA